jgi:hypothetical protein
MRVLIVEDELSAHEGGFTWRDEASAASDVDLAVFAPNGWARRVEHQVEQGVLPTGPRAEP